jgi:hypothetical protein
MFFTFLHIEFTIRGSFPVVRHRLHVVMFNCQHNFGELINQKKVIMKKRILTLVTAFVLIANITFANTGKSSVPESVTYAFNQSFSHAKMIGWDDYGNYYKATFMQRGKTMYAFYSDEAQFMGIAKNVLSDQLPVLLQAGIKNNFQGYWITDLVNYQVAGKNGFLVTIENADEKIVLKTDDDQHWQVYSKGSKL